MGTFFCVGGGGRFTMAINTNVIYNFLNANSNSKLNSLKEYQENLMQKLKSRICGNKNDNAMNSHIDYKQAVVELRGITKQMQQVKYEETARKLKEEQFKNDAAAAKSPSKRERIRRDHETYLVTTSMGKLILAKKNIAVDENIMEAQKLGIEAAEVEQKRKKDEMEANTLEANGEKNRAKSSSSEKKREKKKSLNILV